MACHWDGVASLPSLIWLQPARALRVQALALPPDFPPARLLCASLVCSVILSAWALAPLVSLHVMAWFSVSAGGSGSGVLVVSSTVNMLFMATCIACRSCVFPYHSKTYAHKLLCCLTPRSRIA